MEIVNMWIKGKRGLSGFVSFYDLKFNIGINTETQSLNSYLFVLLILHIGYFTCDLLGFPIFIELGIDILERRLDIPCKWAAVSVPSKDDPEASEPDKLGVVCPECIHGPSDVPIEAVILVWRCQQYVTVRDVLSELVNCCQSEKLELYLVRLHHLSTAVMHCLVIAVIRNAMLVKCHNHIDLFAFPLC